MNTEDILTIMKAMKEHDLSSFELEEGNIRIAIRRGNAPLEPAFGAAHAGREELHAVDAAPAAETAEMKKPEAEKKSDGAAKNEGKLVTSPLVGTFYSAPSPDADPYVKVGDKVKKGQVLGIIEAMKLMNEIEAEEDGTVDEILVNNEEVVEYGQPLFRIV